MSKKLYVGGIAYSVNDEALKNLFACIGPVDSANIITDFDSGRSKGFGFVEMTNPADADTAIQKLNGSIHEGRTITVSEAKPKEGGGRNNGGRGRAGSGNRGNHQRGNNSNRFNNNRSDFDGHS